MDMVTTTASATMTTIASRWQQPPRNDVVEISDGEKTTSLGAGNVANVPIGSEEYRTFLKNRLDLACASVAFLRRNCKERQDSATMLPNKGLEPSNDEEEETDAKRARKMLSNRESTRRGRRRKHDQLAELEAQVSQLKDENSSLLKRLIDVSQKHNDTAIDNRVLKANVETLKSKVKMAEETIKSLLVVKYKLS